MSEAPQARRFLEQLATLVAVSAELVRRGGLATLAVQLALLLITGVPWGVGAFVLFGDRPPDGLAFGVLVVISLLGTVVVPSAMLAAPLAAFGQAATTPEPSVKAAIKRALRFMPAVAVGLILVTLTAGFASALVGTALGVSFRQEGVLGKVLTTLVCAITVAPVFWFVGTPLFLDLGRFGVHGDRARSSQYHRGLAALALLAASIPVVAASAPVVVAAITGTFRGLSPMATSSLSFHLMAVAAGVETSSLLLALLSVASYLVAEGEDAPLLGHDRPETGA